MQSVLRLTVMQVAQHRLVGMAARAIKTAEADLIIAGGLENMLHAFGPWENLTVLRNAAKSLKTPPSASV